MIRYKCIVLLACIGLLSVPVSKYASTITGGSLSGGTLDAFLSLLMCPFGDVCDDFITDTISSGDWITDSVDFSVIVPSLKNIPSSVTGTQTVLRSSNPGLSEDHCQVIYIESLEGVGSAPGLTMRASSSTAGSANRLDVVYGEDVPPENSLRLALRSYSGGGAAAVEDSLAPSQLPWSPMEGHPFWLGACIEGSSSSPPTKVHIFDFGNTRPAANTSGWDDNFVVTLTHDDSPIVDVAVSAGIRTWTDSMSNTTVIGQWFAFDGTWVGTASPSMVVSRSTIFSANDLGEEAPNATFSVSNSTDGTLDFSVSITNRQDCTPLDGGTDPVWLARSPTSGSGVAPGSPITITMSYLLSDECEEGNFTADIVVTATAGATNGPLTIAQTLDIPGLTSGSFPVCPPGDASCSQDVGVFASACPNFDTAVCTGASGGSITTTSNGQVIQNCTLAGGVYVNTNDVTISCVKIGSLGSPSNNRYAINNTGFSGGSQNVGSGLLISHVEIYANGNNANAGAASAGVAIWGADNTMEFTYIEGANDSLKMNGLRFIAEGNWLHCTAAEPQVNGNLRHTDTVQSRAGNSQTWLNNYLRGFKCSYSDVAPDTQTQNLFIQNNDAAVDRVLIQGNFFHGGNGLIKWDADPAGTNNKGKGPITNLTVKDNFATKNLAIAEVVDGFNYPGTPGCYHWSGNLYEDGSAWTHSAAADADVCAQPVAQQ